MGTNVTMAPDGGGWIETTHQPGQYGKEGTLEVIVLSQLGSRPQRLCDLNTPPGCEADEVQEALDAQVAAGRAERIWFQRQAHYLFSQEFLETLRA